MGSKRHRIQMKIDVLRAISEGESLPTRIMYKSNLSWLPLHRILDEMLEDKLVEVTHASPHRSYSITEKGMWAMRAYRELVENGLE